MEHLVEEITRRQRQGDAAAEYGRCAQLRQYLADDLTQDSQQTQSRI